MRRIRSFFVKVLTAPIKLYRYISPYKGFKCCKYIPTCSCYSIEAIEKHGPIRGSLLAAWRILRCNPFSKGGYDPVPKVNHRRIKI